MNIALSYLTMYMLFNRMALCSKVQPASRALRTTTISLKLDIPLEKIGRNKGPIPSTNHLHGSSNSAADRNPLCGKPTALLRNQEQHSIGHIFDCPNSCRSSRLRLHHLHKVRRCGSISCFQDRFRQVCQNWSGSKGVDGNSMATAKLLFPIRSRTSL